jgi:ATP-dependent DNA helicase RecG
MISNIKGIGPKTASIFIKAGIENEADLLGYYPYRFDVLERSNIRELEQDDKIIIDGIVENVPSLFFFNKKMNKMTFRLNSGDSLLNVTIFNRAFLKSKLLIGTKITVIGKYDKKHNIVVASDLRFSLLPPNSKIEPIYHALGGISSNQINQFMGNIISQAQKLPIYVPSYLEEKYHLMNKYESVKGVHFPGNLGDLKKATNYLKYEELFLFMLKMNYLKMSRSTQVGIAHNIDFSKVEEFVGKLPFKLTDDQQKGIKAIYKDMVSETVMKRLLQGDVGSGKTIVAVIALYMNYLSGMQGALMAPTEVLAVQHYNSLKKIYQDTTIKVELLTGKMKAKDRKQVQKAIELGDVDIVVGTHSLFSDDIFYKSLGLVITDEQHRFGVNQRLLFSKKGEYPDILYLSATPIPRTFALTIYGDMDISSIHTLPSGRKEISTTLRTSNEIKEVLDMMQKEVRNGHQVYVIAPLIEESDKIDLENVDELKNKMEKALGKICKIGMLHGRMSSEEKEEVMNDFKENKIQILISTTVIEVGIDVPNATMIVIFDSYRFGLSQLHQLRGRVGRGNNQSYCVLISDKEVERLSILVSTTDGFMISEEDFRLRGSGDLFGTRQSGDMRFSLADIKRDFQILLRAKEDSLELLNSSEYHAGKYFLLQELLEKNANLE